MDNFLEGLFEKFNTLKVAVVGDVMLDTYWWGNVERISPEAPVPVVNLTSKESRLGGAANVALNINALGATVKIFTVIGGDDEGDLLLRLFDEKQLSTAGIVKSKSRLTTSKTRIMSRNQQMLRLDNEKEADLDADDEIDFLNNTLEGIEKLKPDVLILEDYNKGVLTEHVIQQLIARCQVMNIPTCVDPKEKNFFTYKNITVFKPNLKEVQEALNHQEKINLASLEEVHRQIKKRLAHDISFITLSAKGVFYQKDNKGEIIPSHLRNIADVSGAGDTVMATAALVWAVTKNVRLMSEMANIAGGMVCEEVGVVAIDKNSFFNECMRLLI